MQPFPDLASLQSIFWRLLAAPEGAAQGAAALRREGALESEDLSFLVRPDERLDATGRVDIYADMYFYRLRDCLAEDYPRLATWIGESHFHDLVTDYLLAHPPAHFSLRELGRALPGFAARHALAADFSRLGDLAALEWARVDVFGAADAEPLTRESLIARAGAALEGLALRLVPAARLLRVEAAVPRLWKELDEGPTARGTDSGATCAVRVWRQGHAVFHCSVEDDEAACLAALAGGGAALPALGELLAERAPERAEERLAALLDGWLRDGLLVAGDP